MFFFFKQKTAYELRISDWSSDVCSSDLYLLTRWGAVLVKCQLRALHFELEDIDSVDWSLVGTRELELPSVDAIREAQEQFGQPEHDGFELVYDEEVRVLRDATGKIGRAA